jgi:hypothetical protein
MTSAHLSPFVIPGLAKREPGIHHHSLGLWIPGLRLWRIPE